MKSKGEIEDKIEGLEECSERAASDTIAFGAESAKKTLEWVLEDNE